MKYTLIVILFISLFTLNSCEDKERIEEIKSELRKKDKDDNNNEDEGQKKVYISAPSQNEAPSEELNSDNIDFSESNFDRMEESSEDFEYEEEYGDGY